MGASLLASFCFTNPPPPQKCEEGDEEERRERACYGAVMSQGTCLKWLVGHGMHRFIGRTSVAADIRRPVAPNSVAGAGAFFLLDRGAVSIAGAEVATLDACRALLADHLSYGDCWGNPPAGT
ncbi:unnamed protein product [Pleuronectes platessa]|uniref:Uncharacterized protein n=1 Tax=Pleuronectes platessa TaxID=8262 RepID=A0A9N7Y4B4_PLEPL|nr:unnamed protein product [Pleuronectes platessa]